MRVVARTYEVFQYTELSEDAKEKAFNDWACNFAHYGWESDNRDTLNEFCKIFDVSCYAWQYDTCCYNYRFRTKLDSDVEGLSGIRLLKYLINNYYQCLFVLNRYYSRDYKKHRTSRIFRNSCCVLTGYCMDNEILQPIYDFMKNPTEKITFHNLIDSCLDGFFKACHKDMEHYYSQENFEADAEANDMGFLSNGTKFS